MAVQYTGHVIHVTTILHCYWWKFWFLWTNKTFDNARTFLWTMESLWKNINEKTKFQKILKKTTVFYLTTFFRTNAIKSEQTILFNEDFTERPYSEKTNRIKQYFWEGSVLKQQNYDFMRKKQKKTFKIWLKGWGVNWSTD